jgi:hypothetical protein
MRANLGGVKTGNRSPDAILPAEMHYRLTDVDA